MTNKDVVNNWLRGVRGKSGSMSTDGENLFSYQMKIGRTVNGEKQVIEFYKYSKTTSSHIRLAYINGATAIEPISCYFPDEAPKHALQDHYRRLGSAKRKERSDKYRGYERYAMDEYKRKFGLSKFYKLSALIERLENLRLYAAYLKLVGEIEKYHIASQLGHNILNLHNINIVFNSSTYDYSEVEIHVFR